MPNHKDSNSGSWSVYFSLYPPSGIIFNSIHNYLEIMFPIDVLRFSEFRTMRNHLSHVEWYSDHQWLQIRSLVQGRIHKLQNCVNSRPKSIFKDQEAVKCLSSLHDKYVFVPADKASNNIVFVCKSYYFECLIKELVINNNTSDLVLET
jgi:hypothetical protein